VETWEVDETGMTWTFHLRKGVQWQGDYGEMTSADVFYTIEQLMTLTETDSNYVQNKDIIATYTAPDNYTVQISQSSPGYVAVYFMTFPVLCKAYCESENIDTAKPIGTGPYQVTEFNMEEQVSFEVNPSWWKQAPYIQKLTAICIPDHDAEMNQFEQNLLDIVTTSSLTVDTYQKYQEIEYKDYLTQFYDCLVPNMNGIFNDVNLRQAVAYALDKREVVSKALLGHAVATDYPVSPDSYLSGGSSKIYEFNQQKAKELLEFSGWKDLDDDGLAEKVEGDNIREMTMTLLIPANGEETYRTDVAQNIASQLLECGITVNIEEKEPADYKTSLESGSFDLALCTFYMDINPDITHLVGTGGMHNYGGFSDPMMDGLLNNCATALSEDAIKQAYSVMEDQFLAQMPQIGLYYRTNALLYNATLNIADNFRDRNLFSSIPQWYIYVEEPEA
jgi:ABC-type transport system substrate-binding protein